ncbi:MAG: NADH-quinone oxidoreductase subunit M [Bacteroidales bacterium]|nr:NADH-quinone oxidoreductase subunit M [Bacteroidales bacterium]
MILTDLILILMAGALLSWIVGKWSPVGARIISLLALAVDLILTLTLLNVPVPSGTQWIVNWKAEWIPALGISLHLATDGISVLLLLLTFFIGIISVVISWKEIQKKVGFFHFNLLMALAGVTGVFLSLDLFLFYFFWELMLIPMYFMIGIWGSGEKTKAVYKFFIFTQIGSFLMLVSILTLYFIHGSQTGVYTFDVIQLTGTKAAASTMFLIMSGFLAAFFVKLPIVPLHNWLPDTYTAAPTAGTLLLAALLSKTAAYGLIRFIFPLFPAAAHAFAPAGMILGIVAIFYGAKLAYAQTDLKRLIAYSSISHMGFILLGVFAFNQIAYQGVVIQMLAHGITIAALFILAAVLSQRLQTRDLNQMGGLWEKAPMMGGIGLAFAMASLGLPGLGNFIAEFFILLGTFQAHTVMAVIAVFGLLASAIYTLRMLQRIFFGKLKTELRFKDLTVRDGFVFASLLILIVWMGVYPRSFLNISAPAVKKTLSVHQDQMSETAYNSVTTFSFSNQIFETKNLR